LEDRILALPSCIGSIKNIFVDKPTGFYKDAVEGGLYNPNSGGRDAAKADMEWYASAGQLDGDSATLTAHG